MVFAPFHSNVRTMELGNPLAPPLPPVPVAAPFPAVLPAKPVIVNKRASLDDADIIPAAKRQRQKEQTPLMGADPRHVHDVMEEKKEERETLDQELDRWFAQQLCSWLASFRCQSLHLFPRAFMNFM